MLGKFVGDVAAAGEIAEQDTLPIADELRLNVFVHRRILHHGADVNAALVGESAGADKRLIAAQREIGEFGDEAGNGSKLLQLLGTNGGVAELQLQIGN